MGGYQIINLKNTALTAGTPATIKGVYEAIEGNYDKPCLLHGISIAGTTYPDAYVTPTVSASNYTFAVYGYTFTITGDDVVTAAK